MYITTNQPMNTTSFDISAEFPSNHRTTTPTCANEC